MPTTPEKLRKLQRTVDGIVTSTLIPIENETPSGLVNGVNAIFNSSNSFKPNSTKLYLNGVRQKLGISNDYIEIAPNQIQFAAAPRTGDSLILDYFKL
jgi:hypothetical protein